MRIRCLADEDTVRAFRLAGIEGTIAADAGTAVTGLQACFQAAGIGLVIVTEQVAAWVKASHAEMLDEDSPLVLVIPGPGSKRSPDDELHRLVQGAIGLRLEKGW